MTPVIRRPAGPGDDPRMDTAHGNGAAPREAAAPEPFARFRADHARVLARVEPLDARLGLDAPLDEAALHELVVHLGHQFDTHMRAEDQVLYPALAVAFPEGRGALEPLRADHVELRGMLAGIAQALARPRSAWRDEQLAALARDFVDLLRLHIRREEAGVFDPATRLLTAGEIEALALRVRPYLDTTTQPGATGPGKGSFA